MHELFLRVLAGVVYRMRGNEGKFPQERLDEFFKEHFGEIRSVNHIEELVDLIDGATSPVEIRYCDECSQPLVAVCDGGGAFMGRRFCDSDWCSKFNVQICEVELCRKSC